jgi:glycosyltransferase involved in cell wall biosynthesis
MKPTLKIIVPVGPSHENYAKECWDSIKQAAANQNHWSEVFVKMVDDTKGAMGRSAARNSAIHGADWYFFLDADDQLMPDALNLNRFDHNATFGMVHVGGKTLPCNTWPCTRNDMIEKVVGTLSMGFFYKDHGIRFNEDLDVGEDFDFYLRLQNWTKVNEPLVNIRKGLTSAGGPRGNTENKWVEACRDVIRNHVSNAVLGKV